MRHTYLSCTLTSLLLGQAVLAQNAKPNIILIMTDQQRFDCVGAMGNPFISTPHIDGLAKEGVLFQSAYASAPSSTPSRAALLTGSSPWQHGLLGYAPVAEKYPYEMPQMLRDAGYFTFAIGKLHYSPQRNLHGFHGALLDESGRVESADFQSDYRKWLAKESPGANPDATGLGWNDHAGRAYALEERLHPTKWTSDEAVRFIQNYELDQPLFLKVSFARPHSPYDPPQRYLDIYKDKFVKDPAVGKWAARFANRPEKKDASFGDFGLEHPLDSRRHYYASITFIDDQIAEIIRALKEKGIYDNSIIVFVSDHGDMLGDHYHWRKTYAYEGASHIPFIVKPPKSLAVHVNERRDQPIEIRDILPTFLELAEIEQPAQMDGKSLVPLLKDKKASWRKYIDLEHATWGEYDNYWAALTDGKMKYIWFFHTGEEQLFDLANDPYEMNNETQNIKYKKELEQLRNAMLSHLSERGKPFVENGELKVFDKTVLFSPNYPRKKE